MIFKSRTHTFEFCNFLANFEESKLFSFVHIRPSFEFVSFWISWNWSISRNCELQSQLTIFCWLLWWGNKSIGLPWVNRFFPQKLIKWLKNEFCWVYHFADADVDGFVDARESVLLQSQSQQQQSNANAAANSSILLRPIDPPTATRQTMWVFTLTFS